MRIEDVFSEVKVPPYKLRLGCYSCDEGTHNGACTLYLQAMLWRQDIITGEDSWGYGGKYFISYGMSDDELIKKALTAALSYAEHEVREAFEYKGRRVFGPHIPISALWEVAEEVQHDD